MILVTRGPAKESPLAQRRGPGMNRSVKMRNNCWQSVKVEPFGVRGEVLWWVLNSGSDHQWGMEGVDCLVSQVIPGQEVYLQVR